MQTEPILAPDVSPATLALLEQAFANQTVLTPSGPQCYREAGAACTSGLPIVLLHGIGSGAGSWLHVAMHLREHARVIAWDAPGYGGSAPLAQSSPTPDDYAERLLQLLDALNIPQCILVGHSLGTLMGSAFAHRYPARVKCLMLFSPTRGYGNPALAERRAAVLQERLKTLDEVGIAQMARQRPARMLSSKPEPQALALVRWNMERLNEGGYRQAIEMLCNADMALYAPPVMPVAVYSGDEDVVTIPSNCQAIAGLNAAPYGSIERCGHVCQIERPAIVAELINQFCSSKEK